MPPRGLGLLDRRPEVASQEQVLQAGIHVEGFLDPLQELGADDAPAAPQQGDRTKLQRPVVLRRRRLQLDKPLGITADLGSVQGLADCFHKLGAVAVVGSGRTVQQLGGPQAGIAHRGQAAGVHRLGHQGARDSQIQRQLAHPLAGTLGTGRVHHQVDQELARLVVLHAEDVSRDLNQVTVQIASIPLGERGVEFVVRHPQGVLHQPIGFADQLHVAVFDPVMDHLDIMPGSAGPHPIATGDITLRPDLGGNGLEDRPHQRPGLIAAARHDARPLQSPFLAAGHARADEQQPLGFHVLRPPLGVGKMGIAAVDNHIARFEQRNQLVDEIVDRRPRFDHQHHLPRASQGLDEFLERVAPDDILPAGSLGQELVHLAHGPIENGHPVSSALDIEHEVFAHDRQSDQSKITLICHAWFFQSMRRFGGLVATAELASRPGSSVADRPSRR